VTESETVIFDYIAKDMLKGESAGLEVETPLLELNILDSFGIMLLLAHIESEFGAVIAPEELDKKAFENIRSIGVLVDEKRSTD
jgi:acyl carrier protein